MTTRVHTANYPTSYHLEEKKSFFLQRIIDKICQIWNLFFATTTILSSKSKGHLRAVQNLKNSEKTHETSTTLNESLNQPNSGKEQFLKDLPRSGQVKRRIIFTEDHTVSFSREKSQSLLNGEKEVEKILHNEADNWLENTCSISSKRNREIINNLIHFIFSQYAVAFFTNPIGFDLSKDDIHTPSECHPGNFDFHIKIIKNEDAKQGITLKTTIIAQDSLNFLNTNQTMARKDKSISCSPFFHKVLPGSFAQIQYDLNGLPNQETLSVSTEKVYYKSLLTFFKST